jgi:DNA-binding transcriptional ArsR family regulator
VVVLAVLLAPAAAADTTQAPVQGGAHADYDADAGAILAQALAYDPSFRFDLAYAKATVYELRLPGPSSLEATRGSALPRPPVLVNVQRVGAGALALDASDGAAVLLFSDPRGLAVGGLPALDPGEAARFAVQAAPRPALAAPSLHDLDLGAALHYTIQGLALEEPIRAHAEGGLLVLLTRGTVLTPDGALPLGPDAAGDARVLLVQADDAVADVAAEGMTAVLRLPEASLGAGAGAVAAIAGQSLGAGHEARVASEADALTLDTAGAVASALFGADPAATAPPGPAAQRSSVALIRGDAIAAGALLGSLVALAAAGAAALATSGKYGLFALLGPLYARLQHDEVLDNRTRVALYRFVVDHPGVNVSDLVKEFGLGWGATVYHLRVLEKNHLVVQSRQGRQVCYFQNGGTFSVAQRAGLSALRNANAALVARVVLAQPGVQQREICRSTGLAQPTVSWHLQRLEESGLVQADGSARKRYLPLPALQELAQRGMLAPPAESAPAALAPPAATPA